MSTCVPPAPLATSVSPVPCVPAVPCKSRESLAYVDALTRVNSNRLTRLGSVMALPFLYVVRMVRVWPLGLARVCA